MKAVYYIAPGYRSVTVWEGNKHGQRMCIVKRTPSMKLSRQEKYCECVNFLRCFRLKAPAYK